LIKKKRNVIDKHYYISYKIILKNGEIYGADTFITASLDLEFFIEHIKDVNNRNDILHVAILSCTEVNSD
jgi:hypothetical protein